MSDIEQAPALLRTEPLIAAIDNGGTNTRIEIRQGDDRLRYDEYPTPQDYETAVKGLEKHTLELTCGKKVSAVGYAVAGKLDTNGDHIVSAGALEAYGWVKKPFRDDVAGAFGIEVDAVVLLNDCVAAAKAQQVVNKKANGESTGYVEAISTGFGGAGFDGDKLIPDEPGHEHLESGALCGCGKDGCVEAHISGSGIERNYAIKAADLPERLWNRIIEKAVKAHIDLLRRLEEQGFTPESLHFFGSVAIKSPYLLRGLKDGLSKRQDELSHLPNIHTAARGEDGGLIGAGDAALELLNQ